MKSILFAALFLGAAFAVAPSINSPLLCRVTARTVPSPLSWLTSIQVELRPGCPAAGLARVRLLSDAGGTDPPSGWLPLTPCRTEQKQTCVHTWRGVLLRPLGWRPQWQAAGGRAYDIPIRAP